MSVNGDVMVDPVDIHGDISVVLRGEDGLSAYEVAVKNGFSGTEEEWLESLKGEAAKAEAYTNEAKEYWQNAQASAILSGNSAVEAARYRNEAQDIRDAFAPEVADARAAIQAEKEEAEQKKLLVDDAAANAHLDREQADADAAEVRYLYQETIVQKNVATDAAERARLYAEGAGGSATAAAESVQEATSQAQAAEASATAAEQSAMASSASATASANSANASATSASEAAESASNAAQSERNIAGAEEATAASAASAASSAASAAASASEAHEEVENVINSIDAAVDKELDIILPQQLAGKLDVNGKAVDSAHADNADEATHADSADDALHADNADEALHAGDADTVNGHTVETSVPPNAVFTDTTYEVMASSELEDGVSTQGKLIDAHTLATFILTVAADVVNNAPEALDTLAELAQALGNDPNFATTVMTEIGKKLDKAGGVVTGDLTVNGTFTGNVTGNVSGSSGSCTGNAATATKLATARTINIQDSSATNTGTGASFDGSGNATIKLPATIKANITGNCTGSSGSCTGNAATATKATGDKNGNDITTTYANLTGAQTISGVKTFTGKPILTNGITMRVTDTNSTTTRDSQVLYANSSNTANGINVAFGSGGNAVVGGGESYTAQLNALAGNSSEDLYLTSDGNIYLKPNAQTFANAKTITLNTAGELSGLAKVTATAFAGALTGNVTGNCSGSSGSCTGNAANVTGTVAIAHGGTEATTRLGALKNLTNENVGTGSQYFLTITSNWGKGGYASVADVKSVLGIKNFVKSGSTAEAGLVPAPSTTAGTTHYLREDGTWTVPPNTTYSNFVKSGSGAKAGLVPAPSTTAGTTHYLCEDGTWQVPPNTNTDTLMTQNVSSGNATYPVLLCPTANATANQGAKTGIFSAKAVLNASNGQMKLNSKVVPVVSSFNSTTGVLALVSSGS